MLPQPATTMLNANQSAPHGLVRSLCHHLPANDGSGGVGYVDDGRVVWLDLKSRGINGAENGILGNFDVQVVGALGKAVDAESTLAIRGRHACAVREPSLAAFWHDDHMDVSHG